LTFKDPVGDDNMPLKDDVVSAINDHKGHLMALQSLILALLRAMPRDMQARALADFDIETNAARTAFLNLPTPED
jgi:hypothetical protein